VLGPARQAVARWAAQLWADLKASTDAGLLSVARFLGLLYGPIDTHLPIDQALRKALAYRLAPHVGWRHALGGVAYLCFMVLVATGVLLSFYYRPSPQEAYPSIQHIVAEVRFGWLLRDLHVWSANVLVLVALAHMGRVFFDAAYKPPRETSWLIGVLLLFVILAFGATGYLLPWDQWAYWTVAEALGAAARVPLVGALLVELLRGDPIVSGATLSRFFALHVIVLPWIALVLLVFHFAVVRKHGPAPPPSAPRAPAAGVPFFPHHLLRSSMVAVLVCALLITLAVFGPRAVADPADPAQVPETLAATWVVVDVSRALTHYLGAAGFVAFTLLGVALALVPLFDRGAERELRRRPRVAALGVAFYVVFVVAWLAGRGLRTAPGSGLRSDAVEATTPARTRTPLPAPGPQTPRPAPPPDTSRAPGGAR
jgi:quinol-cytochrome oxidoreductase complex cytochrome b subunit